MTRDEVIKLAQEAGVFTADKMCVTVSIEIAERFAALVETKAVAAEREALASLKSDAIAIFDSLPSARATQDVLDVIEWYDAAIRARGEK